MEVCYHKALIPHIKCHDITWRKTIISSRQVLEEDHNKFKTSPRGMTETNSIENKPAKRQNNPKEGIKRGKGIKERIGEIENKWRRDLNLIMSASH
jgi:hypothetical protein